MFQKKAQSNGKCLRPRRQSRFGRPASHPAGRRGLAIVDIAEVINSFFGVRRRAVLGVRRLVSSPPRAALQPRPWASQAWRLALRLSAARQTHGFHGYLPLATETSLSWRAAWLGNAPSRPCAPADAPQVKRTYRRNLLATCVCGLSYC